MIYTDDEDHPDEPGMTAEEAALRRRAVKAVTEVGGLPLDLFLALTRAGIDPEAVQSEGLALAWQGRTFPFLMPSWEARYEEVPEEYLGMYDIDHDDN